MGKTKALEKIQSDDPVLNRLQDRIHEALQPLLANPANALADWRLTEGTGTPGSATLQLQRRTAAQTWATVLTFPITIGTHSAGQVLTIDANGVVSWTTPSASGGWQTGYEIDFAAQPTQNFITGGDGVYTIDGKFWHVLNTGRATTLGIVNGTGLIIESFWGGTYLPACIAAKFNDLASVLQPLFRTEIEIWARVIPAQINIDSEWAETAIIDVDNQADGGPNSYEFRTGLRHGGGTDHWLSLANYLGADIGALTQTTLNLTDNVNVIHLVNGTTAQCFSGTSAAGAWPALSTLTRRGTLRVFTPPNAGGIFPAEPLPLSIGVQFCASNSGVGTNTKMTITNMRVMYR